MRGLERELPPQLHDLLGAFLAESDNSLTFIEVYQAVYGWTPAELDRHQFDSCRNAVSRLRAALDGLAYIENFHGYGYRFVPEVRKPSYRAAYQRALQGAGVKGE